MYAKDRQTVLDRREMLRVKIKSLAEEAKIIRKEERRTHPGTLRNELREHRAGPLRLEARASHLAYGFIRGLTIEQMEPKRLPMPEHEHKALHERVATMVKKYGPRQQLKKAA